MSTEIRAGADAKSDDLLARAGRWVFAKVWLGCLLSGLYAFTRHIGWPEALVILCAALGAVGLAVGSHWLPFWTHGHLTGIALVDVSARIVVWAGLVVAVICLLVSAPAVGAVAGALLLTTAWRTFARVRPEPSAAPRRPPPRQRPAASR
jgi:hypothetical protein